MADWVSITEATAALVLAIVTLVAFVDERGKRKGDEDRLRKIGESLLQLEAGVVQLREAVEQLRSLSGNVSRGVQLAEQAALWGKVTAGINAVRFILENWG